MSHPDEALPALPSPLSVPGAAGPPAPSPAMVGRDAQLRELQEHYRIACQGQGRVVFLAGEPGVGKTRLVREFVCSVANGEEVGVLEGRCYDQQPTIAFGPFIGAVRSLIRDRGPGKVVEAAGAWAANLAKLLPELGQELDGAAPRGRIPTDPANEKRHVFEAVHRVLQPSPGQPVRVLILEDLHWSDETSKDFIEYLAHALVTDRVLVLATYRTAEPDPPPSLVCLLARLRRERRHHQLRIRPLSRDETAAMLRGILGQPIPGRFADALYEHAEGNPFFVEEVVHALAESQRLGALLQSARQGRPLGALGVPASVLESILARVARLDQSTAEVLRYAAVAGRRFDFDLLLRVTGLDEAGLLRALTTLVEQQFVAEEEAEDQYNFRHALTREAVYGSLLGRDRRRRHREVLHAVEEMDRCVGGWRGAPRLVTDVDVLEAAVEVYLRVGLDPQGMEALGALASPAETTPTPLGEARLADASGLAAAAQADHTGAAEHFRRAAGCWHGIGLPFEGAQSRTSCADSLLCTGGRADRQRVAGEMEQARVILAGLGSPGAQDRAPSPGAPSPGRPAPAPRTAGDRPPPAHDDLSRRECEILRLLAAGRSNQEIARESFVTVGTVKTHLHHIYGKLGVGSRTKAVARARELGILSP
ncbi:MAG TPA: AAA family ATPase [Longimicrobiaceae bacterium]|nr:AAA family ATPase [Longimicrobiaceae bacterium]